MLSILIGIVMKCVQLTTLHTVVNCNRCHYFYKPKTTITRRDLTQFVNDVSKRTQIKLSRGEVNALYTICRKESTYRNYATTKLSSSFGLFGFLDRTWQSVGIRKTLCPRCQTEAGVLYIHYRYGPPSRALIHHRRKGYY